MPTKTPDELLNVMIAAYEAEYYAQTGVRKTLKPADSERIELISTLPIFYQLYELIEYKSAMNYLSRSEGEYLDGLGELVALPGCGRKRRAQSAFYIVYACSRANADTSRDQGNSGG